MSRGRKWAWIVVVFTVLSAVGLLVSSVAVSGTAALAEDEDTRAEFSFDMSTVVYARGESNLAVYLTAFADVEFKLEIGGTSFVTDTPYAEVTDEEVTLRVIRAGDEEYRDFESAPIFIVRNIKGRAVRYPYMQSAIYDGTPKEIENVAFYCAGEPCEAVGVKLYDAEMSFVGLADEEITVTVPFKITPAQVTVKPHAASSLFNESIILPEADVFGSVTDEDAAYIKQHTMVSAESGLVSGAAVGRYTLTVTYDGTDENFEVTPLDGEYRINAAPLVGHFKLEGESYLYDGKPHRLQVKYDEEAWQDVRIYYNLEEVTDIGRYLYMVSVQKENYEPLILEAYLVIKTTVLESSSLINSVKISGCESGYDPSTEITLSAVDKKDADGKVELNSTLISKEEILCIYDVTAKRNGYAVEIEGDEYVLRLTLRDVTDAEGVRIVRLSDSGENIEYTFEDGSFVIRTADLKGFVFIKETKVEEHSPFILAVAIILGIAVVLVICAVLTPVFGIGKKRRKSRKRHSRWA